MCNARDLLKAKVPLYPLHSTRLHLHEKKKKQKISSKPISSTPSSYSLPVRLFSPYVHWLTSQLLKAGVISAFVKQFPVVNGLGIYFARLDMEPGLSCADPHTSKRFRSHTLVAIVVLTPFAAEIVYRRVLLAKHIFQITLPI
jgi:hypothetical protein